jgi:hypothetical protein
MSCVSPFDLLLSLQPNNKKNCHMLYGIPQFSDKIYLELTSSV